MGPRSPAEMPKCIWKEQPNAFISCLATGETTVGDLIERQKRCEDLGDKCAGVTCGGDIY